MSTEIRDKELFDRIALTYIKKDIYPVSRKARKFQLFSLIRWIERKDFNHIVDLGCGPGYTAQYLKGNYKKFTGVDYSKEFIQIAQRRNPENTFIQGNIKYIDNILQNNKPDLILGIGILHHVEKLDEVLQSINKICNKDTFLAFIEPYNGNPLIQMLRWARKHLDSSYSKDQKFFSKKELIESFERNGYEIKKLKYQGYFSTPFAQIILKPAFIFNPMVEVFIRIDRLIQIYLNNPMSWNIVCIAKKKKKGT